MMTRKAAPALAAGCTFVVKPAVETPLTMIRLIELAHEAGIPKDVLQVVNGSGREIGEIFTSSDIIRKITFTGSTPVGKSLIKNSADTVKNVTMELGGHAPLIVAKMQILILQLNSPSHLSLEMLDKHVSVQTELLCMKILWMNFRKSSQKK